MTTHETAPKILVLNDSIEILEVIRDILTYAGYLVDIGLKLFTSVEELLAVRPDLLIIDFLWAGDMSGWAFLQNVKQDPRTSDIPVVLCTTSTIQVEELREDLDAMGVPVVLKPFDIDILLEAVERHLNDSTILVE